MGEKKRTVRPFSQAAFQQLVATTPPACAREGCRHPGLTHVNLERCSISGCTCTQYVPGFGHG